MIPELALRLCSDGLCETIQTYVGGVIACIYDTPGREAICFRLLEAHHTMFDLIVFLFLAGQAFFCTAA